MLIFLPIKFESVFKEAVTRDVDTNVGDVEDCEIHVDFLARELESIYEETVVRDIDKNVGGVEDGVIDVDFLAH